MGITKAMRTVNSKTVNVETFLQPNNKINCALNDEVRGRICIPVTKDDMYTPLCV